jgi:hypothetical protein
MVGKSIDQCRFELVRHFSNMYSHVLAAYQKALLVFWAKTSKTMSAVAESFRGYQYFEFTVIKDLAEPSRLLAEMNSNSFTEKNKQAVEKTQKNGAKTLTNDDSLTDIGDALMRHNQPIEQGQSSQLEALPSCPLI